MDNRFKISDTLKDVKNDSFQRDVMLVKFEENLQAEFNIGIGVPPSEPSNIPTFGCTHDAFAARSLVKNGLLDSYEKGLLMEKDFHPISMRNDKSKYDVVGPMEENDYEYLIQKMREGVCDDMFMSLSSVGNYEDDIIQLIRYKDREYGEKIRKYHLTLRGFMLNIMFIWDED